MSFTSEIADFVSRVKVAQAGQHLTVAVRHSKITWSLCEIFQRQGFIQSFYVGDSTVLILRLKYKHQRPLLNHMEMVSKPGRRIY